MENRFCIGHHLRHGFRLNGRVDSVLIIEIDVVGAQAAKRSLHGAADGLRACIGDERVGACGFGRIERQPEFRGEDDAIAVRAQGFAEEFLVVMRTVGRAIDLGGIEKGVAHLHGISDEFRHFTLVGGRTVGVAHAHAAQPDGGDAQAA